MDKRIISFNVIAKGKAIKKCLAENEAKHISDTHYFIDERFYNLTASKSADAVRDVIFERINEVTASLAASYPEYTGFLKKSIALYNSIKDLLHSEHKRLISEYESAESFLQGVITENIYKQGLTDGMGKKYHVSASLPLLFPRYSEYIEKSNALYNKIEDLLPAEHRNLISEYESTESFLQDIIEEAVYKQGLKDGAGIKEILTEKGVLGIRTAPSSLKVLSRYTDKEFEAGRTKNIRELPNNN